MIRELVLRDMLAFLKTGRPRTACLVLVCVANLLLVANRISADEFSILRNSTVLGRNFGLPPVIEFDRQVLVDGTYRNQRQVGDVSLIFKSIFSRKIWS